MTETINKMPRAAIIFFEAWEAWGVYIPVTDRSFRESPTYRPYVLTAELTKWLKNRAGKRIWNPNLITQTEGGFYVSKSINKWKREGYRVYTRDKTVAMEMLLTWG